MGGSRYIVSMKTTQERFWSLVNKTETCWLWTGYIDPNKKQGRFGLKNNPNVIVGAHRYSYEIHFGAITPNDYIDQTCGIITCVNPDHLQLRNRCPGEVIRFWKKVQKLGKEECWLWLAGVDENGYGAFSRDYVTKEGRKKKQISASRFSWELHTGTMPPPDIFVCHTCDNPPCVNPNHLFLGSTQDNTQDMVNKNRQSKCEDHGMAILTETDVHFIRESKLGHSELSRQLGISISSIFSIRKGISWTNLPWRSAPVLPKLNKLSEEDVHFIRESKLKTAELARMFDIVPSAVAKTRKGISWKSIPWRTPP